MARKWAEQDVMQIDFEPVITTTNTVEKWREWAKQDILVKVKTDSIKAAGNGLVPIEPCTAAADIPIGIIRSVMGDPVDFPKRFIASVAVAACDCNVSGAGTGALADVDFGRKIQPDADGKATIVTSGGYARVIGGDKADLRIAFNFFDNYR